MSVRICLFACLVALSTFSFAQKLYIAENGATEIRRSNIDGSSLELMSGLATVNTLRSMVFDEQRNTVFWIESNTIIKKATLTVLAGNTRLGFASNYASVTGANFQSLAVNPKSRELIASSNGSIYKTNLDATTTIVVLPAAYIAGFNAAGLDIDLVNGKIYFVRPITTTEIWIANLNAPANPIQIVANPIGTEFMRDIAVDPIGAKFYYSNTAGVGQIVRRDLTTGANPLTVVNAIPNTVNGIALDISNNFIFWADGATAVGRATLTGAGKINIVTGLNGPVDVALDFSSSLPPKLYWTDPNVNETHRINTNGSDFERYHFNFAATPNGIAIDQNTRYAYWTDEAQSNIIKGFINETTFSDLDTLIDYPNAANGVGGIALDPSNHMMYFAYTAGNKIQRTDYNLPTPIAAGSIQDLATINNPFGVAVDLKRRKLYYTSNSLGPSNTGTLSRSNLDGTSPEVLISQSGSIPQRFMHDVKVDAKSGFVYWVLTQANGLATIYKADISNVSGTATPLVTDFSGEIRGIEIDKVTDKMWWVSRGIVGTFAPAIVEAKLSDGTGISTLHTITFTPPRANFIALDRGCEQPIAYGATIISPLGQTIITDPIATAYFYSGDVIQINITQPPAKGTAIVAADGKIAYTPSNGTVGADVINFQICNQCGLCDQSNIIIDIPNEPPVIAPVGSLQGAAGTIVKIPLSSLISDPNNNLDLSTLTVVTQPTSGASASFNSSNELVLDYNGVTFSGTDNVTIQVCDLVGLCTTAIIAVDISAAPPTSSGIIIYNGISPNEDTFNPYFKIENIESKAPQNKVSIYNRWGDKVFEVENYVNTDPTKRFNGVSDKGNDLPSGVYFYKIEFKDGSPELTGYLTLKR